MDRTIDVTSCRSCPFMRADHTIYCVHPAHQSEADAHIIHRDKLNQVPEKCPLRIGPLIQTIRLERGA